MEKIDDRIREKLRDWQIRRLEVKDRMQSYPEKTLELSKLLDLMDEEHAAILNGMACDKQGEANHRVSLSLPPTAESKLKNERALKLQLQVEASSVDDLRTLMETAFSELRLRVEARDLTSSRLKGSYYGSMSGTLGAYNFDLNLNGGLDGQ